MAMTSLRMKHLFGVVTLFILLVASSPPAMAQCAMCRTALEQENGELAAGFNRAILFLLGAPYLVFGGLAGGIYYHRVRVPRRDDVLDEKTGACCFGRGSTIHEGHKINFS